MILPWINNKGLVSLILCTAMFQIHNKKNEDDFGDFIFVNLLKPKRDRFKLHEKVTEYICKKETM